MSTEFDEFAADEGVKDTAPGSSSAYVQGSDFLHDAPPEPGVVTQQMLASFSPQHIRATNADTFEELWFITTADLGAPHLAPEDSGIFALSLIALEPSARAVLERSSPLSLARLLFTADHYHDEFSVIEAESAFPGLFMAYVLANAIYGERELTAALGNKPAASQH